MHPARTPKTFFTPVCYIPAMKVIQHTLLVLLASWAFTATPAYSNSSSKSKESGKTEARTYGTLGVSANTENFLPFYPTAATIFSGHQPVGLMQFEYGLDIENPKVLALAIKLAPRLRDAYGRVLAQYAGSLYTAGEVPDMQFLAVRMQSATDRIIGKGNARFLVSSLMVRDN
jgi:hypothetical protein